MADPPRRVTQNGQELVLVSPADTKLSQSERRELSLDEFKAMEDELLAEAASGLSAAMAWPEIDQGTEEPPEEWVEKLGRKKAEQKLRVANAAWLPNSEAPVGLKMMQSVFIGITRVRSGDGAPNTTLNYTVVELAVAPPQFPEKEIEGRK